MADIKHIKLTDSVETFDINDTVAREAIEDINDWISNAESLFIDKFYPVGSVIINLGIDPTSYLTGTAWVRTAVGMAIVGVDTGNELMDSAEATFGLADSIVPEHSHSCTISSKSLTTDPSGSHHHTFSSIQRDTSKQTLSSGSLGYPTATKNTSTTGSHTHTISAHDHTATIASSGEDAINKNYQPSMAFYIWKRVS